MALGMVSQQHLDRFGDLIEGLGKDSHHTAQEYPQAVQTFIDIILAGERPHPDDVRNWALGRDWREEDAYDLAEMADTVYYTMHNLGLVQVTASAAGVSG